jgi:DeoR/GlpR family transcriptional regulator of sugar metabolism
LALGLLSTFDRLQYILRLLREQLAIRFEELARLLNVSRTTIRNDLGALEKG